MGCLEKETVYAWTGASYLKLGNTKMFWRNFVNYVQFFEKVSILSGDVKSS